MSSNHLACISVPLAIALEMTPLLAPIVRSMVPMEIPSVSAKIFMRDKILHIARKLSSENLVVRKLSLNFAVRSGMNERPKIIKNRDLHKSGIMNETQEMTKEEILEIFRSEYKSTVRRYERKVARLTLKMNEDYEYFFRWHGEAMYIVQVNLKALRELHPLTTKENLDEIKTALGNQIKDIERVLVEGCQYHTSTSMMANVTDTLRRVAQQELRVELQQLLWSISNNE